MHIDISIYLYSVFVDILTLKSIKEKLIEILFFYCQNAKSVTVYSITTFHVCTDIVMLSPMTRLKTYFAHMLIWARGWLSFAEYFTSNSNGTLVFVMVIMTGTNSSSYSSNPVPTSNIHVSYCAGKDLRQEIWQLEVIRIRSEIDLIHFNELKLNKLILIKKGAFKFINANIENEIGPNLCLGAWD